MYAGTPQACTVGYESLKTDCHITCNQVPVIFRSAVLVSWQGADCSTPNRTYAIPKVNFLSSNTPCLPTMAESVLQWNVVYPWSLCRSQIPRNRARSTFGRPRGKSGQGSEIGGVAGCRRQRIVAYIHPHRPTHRHTSRALRAPPLPLRYTLIFL